MRQKLISYLIEDIAPAIAKSRDPEGEILKFAHAHNMPTALVETLGQLFNTAKTVAHFEKSANRGSDFPLLDVPQLVAKYLEVSPVKSAKIKGESAYDQFACGSDSLPDFFQHLGCPVHLVKEDITETPVKQASQPAPTRMSYQDETHARKNLESLEQARFEFTEDLRSHLTKLAHTIRHSDVAFEQFEQDALALHGDSIKEALDHTARFCNTKYFQVKRAATADANPARLIHDPIGIMAQLEQVKFDMQKIATVEAAIGEQKQEVEHKAKRNFTKERGGDTPLEPTSEQPPKPVAGPAKSAPAGERPSYFKPIAGAATSASEPFRNLPAMHQGLEQFLGKGFNKDQQQVDSDFADAKHMSVLQQLMMNDEVLAEADPQKVVSLFNTLRQTSPSIASDPNIAGVALRSMIQHDGISPFDVKALAETEGAKQKVDFNKLVKDELQYGGKAPSVPSKVN